MFFGGGLIPTYLLVKNLNMLDTIWAILLPGAVNVWNIILARAYFQGIPDELREAAIVDGTSEIQFFFKILLPLSKPIIAVLVLYQFVAQWNSYFDAMIYLKSENLQPLQIVLRSILVQMQPRPGMIQDAQNTAQLQQIAEMVKYSSIVISSLPLIIIYPFFQKYFEKGVMVGSIKG
jgi:putative aldouronate transport system permease protein